MPDMAYGGLTNLTQTFQACHLSIFIVAAFFFGGGDDPYICCTTIHHHICQTPLSSLEPSILSGDGSGNETSWNKENYSGTPPQRTPLGPKILPVITRCPYLRGFRYISGRRRMRNRAVEHNVAVFSELSFAVHRQGMLPRG